MNISGSTELFRSMTKISAQVCGGCKFAKAMPANIMGAFGDQSRLCKRHPPQVTSFLIDQTDPATGQKRVAISDHRAWPTVSAHEEGCGEYIKKILDPNEPGTRSMTS